MKQAEGWGSDEDVAEHLADTLRAATPDYALVVFVRGNELRTIEIYSKANESLRVGYRLLVGQSAFAAGNNVVATAAPFGLHLAPWWFWLVYGACVGGASVVHLGAGLFVASALPVSYAISRLFKGAGHV